MQFRDEDISKTLLAAILTADGLILTLSWGLFDWNMPCVAKEIFLLHLKLGSSFLAGSLLLGILCFQFMVSLSQLDIYKDTSVMKSKKVAISFLFCWVLFFLGIAAFVSAIWRM